MKQPKNEDVFFTSDTICPSLSLSLQPISFNYLDYETTRVVKECDFDRMFEYIVKFDPKSEGSRFSYLVAYELLCDMEAEEGREYDVVPNPYAKESEGPASEITVWCSDLEGCNWQKALGAEMNFCPEAEQVPLDMIAGICLWHITFYGFNPDEEEETFNHSDDQKPETIRIKVYDTQVEYVRALPIHESQVEVETTEQWSIFEYRIVPCYNFYQQLLWHREKLEVLEPQSVRLAMKEVIDQMLKLY